MTRFPAIVPRSHTSRARLMALGALALVAVAAAVILFVRGAKPPGPGEALDPFVAAWTRGDDRGAAALTTDPAGRRRRAGRPTAAASTAPACTRAPTSVAEQGDSARATVLMRWDVPGIGAWTYRTRVALQRRDGHWKVLWRPTVVHPRLTADPPPGHGPRPRGARADPRPRRPAARLRARRRAGRHRSRHGERHRRDARPRWPASSTSTAPRWRAPPAGPGPSSSSRR